MIVDGEEIGQLDKPLFYNYLFCFDIRSKKE